MLSKSFSEYILNFYLNDLIRTICSIVDENFRNVSRLNAKSIQFISQWLLLRSHNNQTPIECLNKSIWCLAHVHTSLEYEQSDLLSVYSACRIVELFDSDQSLTGQNFKNNQLWHSIQFWEEDELNRSKALKTLFELVFKHLWDSLCIMCEKNDNSPEWIRMYNFISTYYPSNKILNFIQLEKNSKAQMDFMRLAYLIFLNGKTPEANKLISNLLHETKLVDKNYHERLDWHELLPNVIHSVQKYFEHQNADSSALIIDLLQWVISILKTSAETPGKIFFLLKYLNQSSCPLSLSMKQFLFDELMDLSVHLKQNQDEQAKTHFDCIDRVKSLLPIIFECLSLDDINEKYQLPYHPSVVPPIEHETCRQVLLDLFFFHLKHYSNSETITCAFINKIVILSNPLKINNNKDYQNRAEGYFKQLKTYFSLKWTAQLVCEIELNENNADSYKLIMETLIKDHLTFDPQSVEFSSNLQLFLSTIISQRSWSHLLKLLQSDHIQSCNSDWANALYSHLDGDQVARDTKYLSEYHQIQFTLSKKDSLSAFPNLHQPYDAISKIIDDCVKNENQDEKWKVLSDWIQTMRNADPCNVTLKEIKVMLLLKIYYTYFCDNRLSSLDGLLELIQNLLEPLPEELIVFRALLQPENYMIGYTNKSTEDDQNFLNKLFKTDCDAEDELSIRHSLVNLMAMILMSGEENFLWTFAFKPSTLEQTYGK